jgi:hypothetical protein
MRTLKKKIKRVAHRPFREVIFYELAKDNEHPERDEKRRAK